MTELKEGQKIEGNRGLKASGKDLSQYWEGPDIVRRREELSPGARGQELRGRRFGCNVQKMKP